MRRRLLAGLRRLPPWIRSVIVAAALLVALSLAAVLSTPTSQHHPPSRRATVPERTGPPAQVPSHPPVLADSDLAHARRAAERFLSIYLRFVYGRASARSVAPVSPPFRAQLARSGVSVTPAERRRYPRIESLQVIPAGIGLVRATGLIEDGGLTSYTVRVTLRSERSYWVVSAISG
jgi:hypothetical protein